MKGEGVKGAFEKGSDSGYILKTEPKRSFGRPGEKYEKKRGEMKKINCLSVLVVNVFFSSLTRMKTIK